MRKRNLTRKNRNQGKGEKKEWREEREYMRSVKRWEWSEKNEVMKEKNIKE